MKNAALSCAWRWVGPILLPSVPGVVNAQDTIQFDAPPTVEEVLAVLGVGSAISSDGEFQTRGIIFKDEKPATSPSAAPTPAPASSPASVSASQQPEKPAPKGNILSIPVQFAINSFEIPTQYQAHLDAIGQALQGGVAKDVRVVVNGHTDSSGSAEYNSVLSAKRAGAVVDYLVQIGVDRSMLIAAGDGEAKLLSGIPPTDPRNRRVDFAAF
jgi:outer membrane protein OmpA-like peptidoglycan-associated protein